MKDIVSVVIILLICLMVIGIAVKIILKRPVREIVGDFLSSFLPW